MTTKQAVESFWRAYKSLPRKQRGEFVEQVVSNPALSEDQIDHILIERARREKGRNITLAQYIKNYNRKN